MPRGRHRSNSLGARALSCGQQSLIFAAVDEETAARLNLPSNVTGTIYQVPFRNMVTAARALVPGLKRIVVVGDAWEQQAVRKYYQAEIPTFAAQGLRIGPWTRRPGSFVQTVPHLEDKRAWPWADHLLDHRPRAWRKAHAFANHQDGGAIAVFSLPAREQFLAAAQ